MINNMIKITIDGEEHAMKPDMKALMAIENTLGVTVLKLCQEISQGNIGFNMVSNIIQIGLKSGTGSVDPKVINKSIMEVGLIGYVDPIMDFFKLALEGTGGKKPVEEPEN